MAVFATLLHLLIPFGAFSLSLSSTSQLNLCKQVLNLPVLEVLPGGGWDNLRNVDAGRVMDIEYTQCQTTEDGMYLLPDQVVTVPQKSSKVKIKSEIVNSWLDYKSSLAYSVNLDISFFWILNARFSGEFQRMKTHQVKENSVTSRTEMRHLIYTVKTNPIFTLDPVFVSRATDIASALENNNTRLVNFLSETLVRDYGTHVLTSIDAGATLAQEDYLASSFARSTSEASLTESASVSFFTIVSLGYNYVENYSLLRNYMDNITYSVMVSHGGLPFYPGITLKTWEESIHNNLVAIDRSGSPLHFFINPDTLPNLPAPTVLKVSEAVFQAIQRYYKVNMYPGCTDPNSMNYNYQANVEDESCDGVMSNFSFGGVFQQCTALTRDEKSLKLCQSLTQKNPLTGNFNCSPSYSQTLLRTEIKEQSSNRYECREECHSCWMFFTCCNDVCGNVYTVQRVTVQTYWCSATNVTNTYPSGFLFGGLYGPTSVNPVTKTKSCPSTYYPATLLSDGLKICLGLDYKLGARYSVPFGGLFSCEAGNPMAGGLSSCPGGYTQHTADVSDGCEILFCVHSGAFSQGDLPPIISPPFTRRPLQSQNDTETVVVVEEDGDAWVRSDEQGWKKTGFGEAQHMMLLSPASGGFREVGALGVTLMTTFSLLIVFL
ncbi:macrophage-expressed gene 1 protein-like [Scleropages formosus]|uniref:Macrophage-expressed gene 1 protein n=1 Tax=Scleropages formosus TaxID=113540 RepID=A0A8C9V8F5_SCLFO|nr:macrophage-expressed gene 1 protein [Scleropages formosus]